MIANKYDFPSFNNVSCFFCVNVCDIGYLEMIGGFRNGERIVEEIFEVACEAVVVETSYIKIVFKSMVGLGIYKR